MCAITPETNQNKRWASLKTAYLTINKSPLVDFVERKAALRTEAATHGNLHWKTVAVKTGNSTGSRLFPFFFRNDPGPSNDHFSRLSHKEPRGKVGGACQKIREKNSKNIVEKFYKRPNSQLAWSWADTGRIALESRQGSQHLSPHRTRGVKKRL